MAFWSLAFKKKWVDIDMLRLAVKTDRNMFGEITTDEFEQITGEKF